MEASEHAAKRLRDETLNTPDISAQLDAMFQGPMPKSEALTYDFAGTHG